MNILDRYKKPTPKFFRILRNLGVSIATAAGTILAVPIPLPPRLLTLATYLLIIGTVVSALSQAAVEDDLPKEDEKDQIQGGQKELVDQEGPENQGEQKQKGDGY